MSTEGLEPIRQLLQQSTELSAETARGIQGLKLITQRNAETISSLSQQVSELRSTLRSTQTLIQENAAAISSLSQSINQAVTEEATQILIQKNAVAISSLSQFIKHAITEATNDRRLMRDAIEAMFTHRSNDESGGHTD